MGVERGVKDKGSKVEREREKKKGQSVTELYCNGLRKRESSLTGNYAAIFSFFSFLSVFTCLSIFSTIFLSFTITFTFLSYCFCFCFFTSPHPLSIFMLFKNHLTHFLLIDLGSFE